MTGLLVLAVALAAVPDWLGWALLGGLLAASGAVWVAR